ncbi:MAG: hypothetical protein ACXW20_10745 [Burkholderiales bacterium]
MQTWVDGNRHVVETAARRIQKELGDRAPDAGLERAVTQHHPLHFLRSRTQRTRARDRNELLDGSRTARAAVVLLQEKGVSIAQCLREMSAAAPELVLLELLLARHGEIIVHELALVIPRRKIEEVDQLIEAIEFEALGIDQGLQPAAHVAEGLDAVVRRKLRHQLPRVFNVGQRMVGLATHDPLQHVEPRRILLNCRAILECAKPHRQC